MFDSKERSGGVIGGHSVFCGSGHAYDLGSSRMIDRHIISALFSGTATTTPQDLRPHTTPTTKNHQPSRSPINIKYSPRKMIPQFLSQLDTVSVVLAFIIIRVPMGIPRICPPFHAHPTFRRQELRCSRWQHIPSCHWWVVTPRLSSNVTPCPNGRDHRLKIRIR